MKYIMLFILLGVLLITSVSAMSIQFYYSPSCPHCQNVMPTINSLIKSGLPIKVFDITQKSYDIPAVPFIKLITDDCRTIEITGDAPILKQLPCELQQISTPQCQTYPAVSNHKGSWFVN